MDKSKTILIVGLGLIGGSYAMALHRRGFRVTAIDIDCTAISYALQNDLINDGGVRKISLIQQADFVIFGLYPTAMVKWIKENQQFLKPGSILTDVSGVKRAVIYQIQEILRSDVEFIGSHPMAGKEVGGIQNSSDKMFLDANFIVTPTEKNTQKAIRFAKELGETLGFSRVSELSCEEHDKMIGYLSQLTHVIAVSLMNANDNPHLFEYTGDSFRDLTRIAKINENLWNELFFLNKDILVPEIDDFILAVEDLKQKLIENDQEGLKKLLIQSAKRRKLFDQPNHSHQKSRGVR